MGLSMEAKQLLLVQMGGGCRWGWGVNFKPCHLKCGKNLMAHSRETKVIGEHPQHCSQCNSLAWAFYRGCCVLLLHCFLKPSQSISLKLSLLKLSSSCYNHWRIDCPRNYSLPIFLPWLQRHPMLGLHRKFCNEAVCVNKPV